MITTNKYFAIGVSILVTFGCSLVWAQGVAEPKLPSITDQHGVQLNSGSVSLDQWQGKIGNGRPELSRIRAESRDGFNSLSYRDNVINNSVHYDYRTGYFDVAAEETKDRFYYDPQTKQFVPVYATLSTGVRRFYGVHLYIRCGHSLYVSRNE